MLEGSKVSMVRGGDVGNERVDRMNALNLHIQKPLLTHFSLSDLSVLSLMVHQITEPSYAIMFISNAMGNNSLFLMYLLTTSANQLFVGNTIFPLWWWDASLKISRSWFIQFWWLVQQVHCILVLKLLPYNDCYLRYWTAFVTFELKCISDSLHDNTTRVITWDFSVVVIGLSFCLGSLGTTCGSVPKVKCLCYVKLDVCFFMLFRLDFTYNSNNWGVGLPPKEKNEKNWPL